MASSISFVEEDVRSVAEFVEGQCNRQCKIMGVDMIKIDFKGSEQSKISLSAPVMRASSILDVLSLYTGIGFEISEPSREIAFKTEQ